jgi:hypothetical protein
MSFLPLNPFIELLSYRSKWGLQDYPYAPLPGPLLLNMTYPYCESSGKIARIDFALRAADNGLDSNSQEGEHGERLTEFPSFI